MTAMRSAAIGILMTVSLAIPQQSPTANLPMHGYQIVRVYPHDPSAFTQGLQFLGGALYEGTGLNGRSSIRRVELETGKVLQKHDVPPQHVADGITLFKSDLIQLPWQPHDPSAY